MKNIKITVMKKICHHDLIEKYENPIENACDMQVGQIFISINSQRPENFCESAWENIFPYVFALSHGAENFFDGWMKNKKSAMISCNDGFRPVSFLLETFDENIISQKKILRREVNLKLKNISPDERINFSRAVVKKFLASSVYKNSKIIMAYLSLAEEIQLNEFISTALEQKKIIAVPFIENKSMQAVILKNFDSLEVGAYGILTVKNPEKNLIPAEKIDCVIVPGLAFDENCNRLGKGGGYYDKFLQKISAKKIAFAYDCQLFEKIPVESHDLPVDAVITPTKLKGGIEFGIGD